MGIFFVWMPLAGLQALGHYKGDWSFLQSLHIDQLFIPAWIHTGLVLMFLFRVFHAWKQGKLDKLAAAAKAIAEE